MIVKSFAQIYALLVCLVTTLFLLFQIGFAMKTSTQLLVPQYSYYGELAKYESNGAYIQSHIDTLDRGYSEERLSAFQKEMVGTLTLLRTLSPAQIEARRHRERQAFLDKTRVSNIMDLIASLQFISISALFLYIHYRIYRRASAA